MTVLFKKIKTKDYVALSILMVSVIILLSGILSTSKSADVDSEVGWVEHFLDKRVNRLDRFSDAVLSNDETLWLDELRVPDDMVIYKYVDDTLRSWYHQFPVKNDDISRRMVYPVLANPKAEMESVLLSVGKEPELLNMGPKWYLVSSKEKESVKVIAGLEIVDELDASSSNKINRHLHVQERYSIKPLSYSCGLPVSISDSPVFKLMSETRSRDSSIMVFVSLLAFAFWVVGWLLFLHNGKTIKRYWVSLSALTVVLTGMLIWGKNSNVPGELFSPALFADEGVFYSLGAVAIINMMIIILVVCTYFVRNDLMRNLIRTGRRHVLTAVSAISAVFLAGIWLYSVFTLRSIVFNSGISLELYKMGELSPYSAFVFANFLALLMVVPLLLQMLRPAVLDLTGKRYNAFSAETRIFLSILFAASIMFSTTLPGLRKEYDKQNVWANRLSVDRDIVSELNLRSVESGIEKDAVISALAGMRNTANIILNRITDNYLARFVQDYDISVSLLNDYNTNPESVRFWRNQIDNSEPIASGSHFLFSNPGGIHAVYTGVFMFLDNRGRVTNMLVVLEPKANKEDKGYSALLGVTSPGKVLLPSPYCFAKYKSKELVNWKGNYPYPMHLKDKFIKMAEDKELRNFMEGGYLHFLNVMSDDEFIIISRPKTKLSGYVSAFMTVSLVAFFALTLLLLTRKKVVVPETQKSYYKSRVSSVLVISLLVTLFTMAGVSVFFVYQRNDDNLKTMMSDKVNSIQALVENSCRGAGSIDDLKTKEFKDNLEMVSNMTKTDISLYDIEGKVIESTTPEIFEKGILGSRMSMNAFSSILFSGKRYLIQKERLGSKKYNALYAPVFNSNGEILAIMSSPYADENYDFRMDAVRHSVSIITVFLILLIIARFMIRGIISRMFKPLQQMGEKMKASDVESLEYLKYDSEDEITSLIEAYNRMVGDLNCSTRALAQAERDKAWSAMARQVAHEIKNPLTPMKLQLQRLIRLKQKNSPDWDAKFDEVSSLVLEHIDILTDTANEFSTFAKLYSEEPTLIRLDALIRDEVSMFDNKDTISFESYILDGVEIMGPKPQLTRVLVNLLSNAVQAVEIRQQEQSERGDSPDKGAILIQLRHSSVEGYYDIVIEDNGNGVSEENRSKLFTPNFTTKSSGTGLGLAISKNILEKCDAQIEYSQSFTLKGACFTVRYPKMDTTSV